VEEKKLRPELLNRQIHNLFAEFSKTTSSPEAEKIPGAHFIGICSDSSAMVGSGAQYKYLMGERKVGKPLSLRDFFAYYIINKGY
jgi:hypothetical protein